MEIAHIYIFNYAAAKYHTKAPVRTCGLTHFYNFIIQFTKIQKIKNKKITLNKYILLNTQTHLVEVNLFTSFLPSSPLVESNRSKSSQTSNYNTSSAIWADNHTKSTQYPFAWAHPLILFIFTLFSVGITTQIINQQTLGLQVISRTFPYDPSVYLLCVCVYIIDKNKKNNNIPRCDARIGCLELNRVCMLCHWAQPNVSPMSSNDAGSVGSSCW